MTPDQISAQRAAIVTEAQSWLGTPFHHRAQLKGVGVDCAQLLIACYATIDVPRPLVGEYAADWFLHEGSDDLTRFERWVAHYCVPTTDPQPGDLALFRYGRAVSHGAIVVDVSGEHPVVIHSFRELGVVLGSLAPTHDLYPRLAGYWTLRRWSADGGVA